MLSFFFGSLEDKSVDESIFPPRNEDMVVMEDDLSRGNFINTHKSTVSGLNRSFENLSNDESAVFPKAENVILQDDCKNIQNSTTSTVDLSRENMNFDESAISSRTDNMRSTEGEVPQDNCMNTHKATTLVVDKNLENVTHEDSAGFPQNEDLISTGISLPQDNCMKAHKSMASVVSFDYTINTSNEIDRKRKMPQVSNIPSKDNSQSSNMLCELRSYQQEKGPHCGQITTKNFDVELESINEDPKSLICMDVCTQETSHATILDAFSNDTESTEKHFAALNKETLEPIGNDTLLPTFDDVVLERLATEQSLISEGGMADDDVSFDINISSVEDENQCAFDFKSESSIHREACNVKFKPRKRIGDRVDYVASRFSRGDLVWAKVKSHPWWPGQIFNASDASAIAKKTQKSGRLLVAFFGDGTFGWLKDSQLIAFKPNFEQKVKQTNMKSFSRAVAAALDEVCRRSELGLNHSRYNVLLYSKNTFLHANAGIQNSVKIEHHPDISMSRVMFSTKTVLEFIKTAACCSFHQQNFSVEYSEICGHAYGTRSFLVNSTESNLLNIEIANNKSNEKAIEDTLKRRFSSVEAGEEAVCAERKEAKKPHLSEKDKSVSDKGMKVKKPQLSEEAVKISQVCPKLKIQESILSTEEGDTLVENKDRVYEGPAKEATSSRSNWPLASQECEGGKSSNKLANLGESETAPLDSGSDGQAFLDITGYPSKVMNKKHEKILKREKQAKPLFSPAGFVLSTGKVPTAGKTFEDHSQGSKKFVPGALPILEFKESEYMEGFKKYDIDLSPVTVREPSSGKERKMLKGEKRTEPLCPSEGDNLRKTKKMRTEVREVNGQANIMHRSKEQDEKVVAKNLNMSCNIKHLECRATYSSTPQQCDFDVGSEALISNKSRTKTFGHSLIQIVQGLQVLARDPLRYASRRSSLQEVMSSILKFRNNVFLKSSGYGITEIKDVVNRKALEKAQLVTHSVKHVKPKSTAKESLSEQNEVQKQPSSMRHKLNLRILSSTVDLEHKCPIENVGLQSHTYASQTGKDSIVLERGVTTPCLSPQNSIPGLQELAVAARKKKSEVEQDIATTKSIEQSFREKLSKMKFSDLKHGYRNMKQHHSSKDPSDSSYMKMHMRTADAKATETSLGLFMQFPKDFTMPSEAQVNKAFNRFGILENAGIRLYKNTSAAQVIFKLNSDAEAALKYALENRIFGVDVSYKLRHFSRSQKNPVSSNTSASNHTICRRDYQGKSPLTENLEENVKEIDSVTTTCIPADPVMSHQQIGRERLTANKLTVNTNPPNLTSPSNVNVPSCDIKDQMMKLLHEVSLIVNSCSLNPQLLHESLILDIDDKY